MPCLLGFRVGLAICGLLGVAASGHAAPPQGVLGHYRLVDLGACKTPRVAPPAPLANSYAAFNFRRRFLDLDGSGQCVMMDFWIARIGGSAAVGMRTLEHRFMRVVDGKWQPFETGLSYFPHAIKSRSDAIIYLIDAPTPDDIGDSMALALQAPRVFTVAGWQDEGDFGAELTLRPVEIRRADMVQALTALRK